MGLFGAGLNDLARAEGLSAGRPAPASSGLEIRVAAQPGVVYRSPLPRTRLEARAPGKTAPSAPATVAGFAPTPGRTTEICPAALTRGIPGRPRNAASGSEIVARAAGLHGAERDRLIARAIASGNLPDFLRRLTPVIFLGDGADGRKTLITLCVTPDYLSVGDDADFVRMPMGLPAAAALAEAFGFLLPTTRIVDAIYAQADVRLAPSPMPPGAQMVSTDYLLRHNATVQAQDGRRPGPRGAGLIAGQKKDLVLSNRLRSHPGRVAIYGWHRPGGAPIQPLSTVHGAGYADYSHGVRLVSKTAFVDGRPVPLADILADPAYARILSSEGPIRQAELLMASLRR
jgi:hypothetical protein